jgi:hypothetical protein
VQLRDVAAQLRLVGVEEVDPVLAHVHPGEANSALG